MSFRPWVQHGHSSSEEVIRITSYNAKIMQDGCRRNEQVRLRKGVAHRLAPFDKAAPDKKDVFVYIQQPVGEPRPQLVSEPGLQPSPEWIGPR
jgi:hypothetical protein